MSIRELLEEYIEGSRDGIDVIRMMTGAFNEKSMMSILVLVNQVTRCEQGDLSKEVFGELLKKISGDSNEDSN